MDLDDMQNLAKPLTLKYQLEPAREGLAKFTGWLNDIFSKKENKDTSYQKHFNDRRGLQGYPAWGSLLQKLDECKNRKQPVMVVFDSLEQIPGENVEACEASLSEVLKRLTEYGSIFFEQEHASISTLSSGGNAKDMFKRMYANPHNFAQKGHEEQLQKSIRKVMAKFGKYITTRKARKPIKPNGTFDKQRATMAVAPQTLQKKSSQQTKRSPGKASLRNRPCKEI